MKYFALHNGHDSSITAFENDQIIIHFELERRYEIKHFAGLSKKNEIGNCVDKVLNTIGWKQKDIDAIVFCSLVGWNGQWSKTEFADIVKDKSYERDVAQPYTKWKSTWRDREVLCCGILHHVNHMAYSFFTSPYETSLLFSLDGMGDFCINSTYGIGSGNKIEYLGNTTYDNPAKIKFCNLGITYSLLGHLFPFLGKDPLACAGKAMGLSSYGEPKEAYRNLVKNVLYSVPQKKEDSYFWDEVKKHLAIVRENFSIDYDNPNSMDVCNLMATFQDEAEIYVSEVIDTLQKKYKINNICLSGGCALNCQVNTRLKKVNKNIFIPPACSDSGLSIGAGLYFYHHIMDKNRNCTDFHNPYLGEEVTWNHKKQHNILCQEYPDFSSLVADVALFLKEGNIVAWCQGKSEIGPRALGNRSILCAPFPTAMKDVINKKIKHREFWRPFAPICLEEYASEYFEIDYSQPYMLETPKVKENKILDIPATTHIDGTARLQTVSKKQNSKIYELIQEFYKLTKIPILLNTSLNDKNKPLANYTDTILRLLVETELNYAVIDNKVFKKSKNFL